MTDWEKSALKYYGRTFDPKEAGYILQNGAMLDFSGKRQGGQGGQRALDHREIGVCYEHKSSDDGTNSMIEFQAETGAIRFSHFGDYILIDLCHPPTEKQTRLLSGLVRCNQVDIDWYTPRGDIIKSWQLENPLVSDFLNIISGLKE